MLDGPYIKGVSEMSSLDGLYTKGVVKCQMGHIPKG